MGQFQQGSNEHLLKGTWDNAEIVRKSNSSRDHSEHLLDFVSGLPMLARVFQRWSRRAPAEIVAFMGIAAEPKQANFEELWVHIMKSLRLRNRHRRDEATYRAGLINYKLWCKLSGNECRWMLAV
eukprot:scaffold22089_cov139-Skeletonema_dohrnii-CCMP3373.AAC.1